MGIALPRFFCAIVRRDIEGPMKPSWAGILRLIDSEVEANTTRLSKANAWNDADMMVVGQGLSAAEDRAHISMWAMLASPMVCALSQNFPLSQCKSVFAWPDPHALALIHSLTSYDSLRGCTRQ